MNNKTTSGGTSFFTLLAILFIGLKLGGVIDWSWWWVLGPLWIPIAIAIPLFCIVFAVGMIVILASKK